MALQLTKNTTRDFSGTKKKKVTLGITGAGGVEADILSIHYNGKTVIAPPYEFEIASGDMGLVVVFVAAQEVQVFIQEVDSADQTKTQNLAQPTFRRTMPNATILIRGQ